MDGLCAKAMLSVETQMRLKRLFAQRLRISLQDGLHLTVMQHDGEWPKGLTVKKLEVLLPLRLEASLVEIEVWGASERAAARGISEDIYQQNDLLVAVAKSNQAWDCHRKLIDLGFTHVFNEFRPHVTLARGKPGSFPPGMLATIRGTALKNGLDIDLSSWDLSQGGFSF